MTRDEMRKLSVAKQLLITESAVNRTALIADLAELRAEAEALAEQVTSVGSLAELAWRCFDGSRRSPEPSPRERPRHRWLRAAIDAGSFALQLWRSYSERRKRPGQPEQPAPEEPTPRAPG